MTAVGSEIMGQDKLGSYCLMLLVGTILFLTSVGRTDARHPDEAIVLPETVVTASRIPATLEDIPDVTIIDRGRIEETNPASVVDLLRQVAGLHVDQHGGRGGISSAYLRGSDPNFTLVMVDGVKVNDPTNARGGTFDFSTLSVDNIERIEIIRGPVSSVYGSDALAGAINILTRPGSADPVYAIGLDAGLHGYYRGSVTVRGPLGGLSGYALTASYADSGGIVEDSESAGSNFTGQFDFYPADVSHIKATVFYNSSHSESFPDDSGGPRYASYRERDERDNDDLAVGVAAAHDLFPWMHVDMKGNYSSRKEEMKSPGVAPGARDPFGIPRNAGNNRFSRTTAEVSGLFSVSDLGWVNLGFDTQVENGESDSEMIFFGMPVPSDYDLDRQTSSAFVEARFLTPVGLALHGGLRFDFPEDLDAVTSPEVSAVYRAAPTGTILKASWGKGFKLPSFYALGHPIVGNPDLVPETSENYDISMIQDCFGGKLTFTAGLFGSIYWDIIDFEEGPPPRMVNRSKATARGGELGIDVRLFETLSVSSHLSHVKTDIEGTDEALRNRPQWRGGMNARWVPVPDAVLQFSALYVGDILDSSIPTGDRTLDDYIRIDVSGTWRISPGFHVGVMIDNLLDEGYEEYVGFPAPGLQVRATVRFLL